MRCVEYHPSKQTQRRKKNQKHKRKSGRSAVPLPLANSTAPDISLPRALPSFHCAPFSVLRLRHGRLALPDDAVAAATASHGTPGSPPPPPPRLPLPVDSTSRRGRGGGSEASGWWGRRRRDLLRAVQRDLRPPRAHPWREAQDARLCGAPLPARHARGEQ